MLSRTQLPAPNALARYHGAKNLDKGTGLWWRERSGGHGHERRDKEVLILWSRQAQFAMSRKAAVPWEFHSSIESSTTSQKAREPDA
jgi:hypothetical protein